MDGVLIDPEELHAHAKRIAFAHVGIALSDADLRDVSEPKPSPEIY
jgi:beta-phosphoglucomutase-like phosphatase (HAD superfamily)